MATTGSTFERDRVSRGRSRARHELTTTIQGMSTQAGNMVFEALFVRNHHMVVDCAALEEG